MPVSSSLALALLLMAPVGQALAFSVPLCGGCAPRAACGSGASSLRAVGARPSESRLTAEGARSQSAVLDAMLSRRTINEFERALPDGWESALRRAVRAAIFAPNHKRTEPWRFHLLGPEAIRRVCELNAELVAQKKGSEAGEKKLKRWLAMPGWLVVTQVVTSADSGMDEPAGMLREDYAACCCAVQNLCLSLHAEGLGTKWTTGAVNFDERFRSAAELPENEQVVGTIWFGSPAKTPAAPLKRLAVDDVLVRHD